MASGISGTFHWPTTSSQLYTKFPFPLKPPSMSNNMPSFSNSFPNMDFLASSSTPLKFSDQIVSSSSPESSASPKDMFAMDADSTPTDSSGGLQSSSPFSTPFEIQSNFPSTTGTLFDDECISGALDASSIVPIDASASELAPNLSDSPASTLGKQGSSSLANIGDADSDRLKCQSQNGKRRKMQKKRVVLVPIGDGKQKGDTPPSDNWAWRKYGQKPIKGSPYPRGYYRCSSSKGCSARKQVERSSTDPNTLVVTYTSDHDHPCPANKSAKAASIAPPAVPSPAEEQETEKKYQEEEEQEEEKRVITGPINTSALSRENLFSSIINSPQAMQEQVVSPLESRLQESEDNCFNFQHRFDANLCSISGAMGVNDEDHEVFDDLEELPELATIFNKGYLEESFLMYNGYGANYFPR